MMNLCARQILRTATSFHEKSFQISRHCEKKRLVTGGFPRKWLIAKHFDISVTSLLSVRTCCSTNNRRSRDASLMIPRISETIHIHLVFFVGIQQAPINNALSAYRTVSIKVFRIFIWYTENRQTFLSQVQWCMLSNGKQ